MSQRHRRRVAVARCKWALNAVCISVHWLYFMRNLPHTSGQLNCSLISPKSSSRLLPDLAILPILYYYEKNNINLNLDQNIKITNRLKRFYTTHVLSSSVQEIECAHWFKDHHHRILVLKRPDNGDLR